MKFKSESKSEVFRSPNDLKFEAFLSSFVANFGRRPESDAYDRWREFVLKCPDMKLLSEVLDKLGEENVKRGEDGGSGKKITLPLVAWLFNKTFKERGGKFDNPYAGSQVQCGRCRNKGKLWAVYGYKEGRIISGVEWDGESSTAIVTIPCSCEFGNAENAVARYPENIRCENAKRGYGLHMCDGEIKEIFARACANKNKEEGRKEAVRISKYAEVEERVETNLDVAEEEEMELSFR